MEEEEVENTEPFSAERYAAEALASDMEHWIKFHAGETPRAEFDLWLQSNRPSQVSRYGDEEGSVAPVGWIVMYSPHFGSDGYNHKDFEGLEESWERLLKSGRPVTFQTVRELALDHGILSGKWLMHLDTGFKVDHAWECIAQAILNGKIDVAKVSPRNDRSDAKHVICVYNRNFTDEEQVIALDAAIRAAGVKCPLSYKPDVYTHLGIYRNNRWKLCPTIYDSKFDLESVPRRSYIVNKVTHLKVT